MNSLGDYYFSHNIEGTTGYHIRKIYPNGIITTVKTILGGFSSYLACVFDSTIYYSENKRMVLDTLYVYEFPTSILNKLELTFEYPQALNSIEIPKYINYALTPVIGQYLSNVMAGDGGFAIDGRISIVYVDVFDGIVSLASVGNVRFIDNQTGIITEVFSSKGHGFYKALKNFKFIPKGIIYSYNGGNPEVFISDHNSASIFKYSLKNKSMEPMKKYFLSELNNSPATSKPHAMALDSSNNLIVSNDRSYWASNFLVNITKESGLKVIFGQNKGTDETSNLDSSILNRPYSSIALVYNMVSYIVVTDKGNNRVLLVNTAERKVKTIADRKVVSGPSGVCYINDRGLVIFSDTYNHCLRFYNLQTGVLGLFAGKPGIKGFSGGSLLNSTFNQPAGLDCSSDTIMVADSHNHAIREINFNRKYVETVAGTGEEGFNGDLLDPLATKFNRPMGVGMISSSSILVADTNNHRVRSMSLNDRVVRTIAGSSIDGDSGDEGKADLSLLNSPYDVRFSDSLIFIADSGNNKIRVIDSDLTIRSVIGSSGGSGFDGDGSLGLPAKLNFPTSININPSFFLIADSKNNRIRYYYTKEKTISTYMGGFGDKGPPENSIGSPAGITVTQNDEIYVADVLNNLIRRIKGGVITTIAGTGSYGYNDDSDPLKASLASPSNVDVSPTTKEIVFSDTNNHRIRMINRFGKIVTLAGTGIPGFNGDSVATDTLLYSPTFIKFIPPKYEDIVFTDSNNGRIRKIKKVNNVYKVFTIADSSLVGTPEGLSISNEGEIYFADSKNMRIAKFTPICQPGYLLNSDKDGCIPTCFRLSALDSSTCSSHGSCLDKDNCQCENGYTGASCQFAICYGISAGNFSSCYYRGKCTAPNNCTCQHGFSGDQCEFIVCFGKTGTDVCSNRGKCVGYNSCQCEDGFIGDTCETNIILIGSLAGVFAAAFIVIGVVVVILLIVFSKYRKQKKIIDTDLTLDERLLSQTELEFSNTSPMRSNNYSEEEKFIIPIDQLNMDKPIKRLGEGGMGAVFLTKYNGMKVAVKVFDLNNFNISEDDFKIEAILLSKLRHPNIINFYGISSTPTKRFIAMECMDKSLESMLNSLQKGTSTCSFKQKISIIINVVSGINYLHNLEPNFIIHRDLKPANILLDKNGIAKLCDFGLGRAMSSNTMSAITANIGTYNYMSPELFSGEIDRGDARSIDVYSLAIIMWQIVFEIMEPYQSLDPKVLEKLNLEKPKTFNSTYHFHKSVCEDGLRPIIPFSTPEKCKEWCEKFLDEESIRNYQVIFELTKLIQQAWSHDPSKRPTSVQIMEKVVEWEERLL